ncbi:hypothetical protein BDZ97DRAFT_1182772 [Flammula alnicola]|nr:hypothetical protein BDZ97DRAFT_1182772 [Flammula alnicola]
MCRDVLLLQQLVQIVYGITHTWFRTAFVHRFGLAMISLIRKARGSSTWRSETHSSPESGLFKQVVLGMTWAVLLSFRYVHGA